MSKLTVTSAAAFEAKYRAEPDPWNFRFSTYERGRYDSLLAALGRPRYRRAFEPGCSIGELTQALAGRCDDLIATDFSATALERARARCEKFAHVLFEHCDLSAVTPAGPFDLIVLSEIGYYFDVAMLTGIAERLCESLAPGGELLAGHWLGHSEDHVLHGDEVHRVLQRSRGLQHCLGIRRPGFRIDRWLKP